MAGSIFKPPKGAVNCHAHVIGPQRRFPFDPGCPFPHPEAPVDQLFAMQDHYGFDRLVLVQSLAHGADHAAATHAIAMRPGTTRGVAIAPKHPTLEEFRALAEKGFVAARVHMLDKLPNRLSPEELDDVARCAAEIGWHIEIHCSGAQLDALLPRLPDLPCRAIIDHMAYPAPQLHKSVRVAVELPNVFVKISAPDRVDEHDYEVGATSARILIEQAPEKLLWGNDWPHVGIEQADDDQLIDFLGSYAPEAVQKILVETPKKVYLFDDFRSSEY